MMLNLQLGRIAIFSLCSATPHKVLPSLFTGSSSAVPTLRNRSQMVPYATSSSSSKLLFRQLLEKDSSTYTYLLADVSHPEKPALLIDPVDKTVDRDLILVQELGLKLIYAMNTHVHADHITGTGLIKSKIQRVKSVISKASNAKADMFVESGDKIYFGDLFLEVRSTPGHTCGCVTYVTGDGADQPQPRMAFTGDALLIRGCGRTDFQVLGYRARISRVSASSLKYQLRALISHNLLISWVQTWKECWKIEPIGSDKLSRSSIFRVGGSQSCLCPLAFIWRKFLSTLQVSSFSDFYAAQGDINLSCARLQGLQC